METVTKGINLVAAKLNEFIELVQHHMLLIVGVLTVAYYVLNGTFA